jgi:hypothetical protein
MRLNVKSAEVASIEWWGAGGQVVSAVDHSDIRGSSPHAMVPPEPASH